MDPRQYCQKGFFQKKSPNKVTEPKLCRCPNFQIHARSHILINLRVQVRDTKRYFDAQVQTYMYIMQYK